MPASLRTSGHGHVEPHVCIVLDGSFEERGSTSTVMSAGTVRLSPAGDVHDLAFSKQGARCLLLLLGDELTREVALPRGRIFTASERIALDAQRIAAELGGSCLLVELQVLEILARLANPSTLRGGGRAPGWLVRVRDALHGASDHPPTTAQLAAEAGLHPVYVARAFRRWYGCSLATYARRLRLEGARRLLFQSDASLARIATIAGFSDQSHLTRAVRRGLGITPAQLRRQVASVQDLLRPAS